MSRRPGESAADWYERAIVAHSVAATHREIYPWAVNQNPAARDAIARRVSDTPADLGQAAAAFRAERSTVPPVG